MFNPKKSLLLSFLVLLPVQLIAQVNQDLTPVISYLLSSTGSASIPASVKKTGQTRGYDENGNTNNNLKDDGHYQTGAIPRYTRAAEIVTDELTRLMWQDNFGAKSSRKKWITNANYVARRYSDTSGDTATTYCSNLNLGGYTDWRLPAITELQTLVLSNRRDPVIDTAAFYNTSSCYYWSSTVHADKNNSALYLWFKNGGTTYDAKDGTRAVRCVRTGQ